MDERAEFCRNQANACRAMAATSRHEMTRARFLDLAQQWDHLADERETLPKTRIKLPGDG